MDLALITFSQIVTMVILMTIGFICAKTNLIDLATNKKLSSFVLMLVNPLVIFLSYQRDFEMDLLIGLVISLGLAVLSYAISLIVTHVIYHNRNGNTFALEKYACVYTNSGFIGIPLVQGVFGSEGVFYLTAYLTVFNLLVWTHGVIIMSGRRDFRSIRQALVSPPLLATLLGLVTFLVRFQLPEFLAVPMGLLGATNTPLAMIVAGVSMTQVNIRAMVTNSHIYVLAVIRLLLIPLLVVAAFSLFSLPTILTGTSIIAVATPVAANIILFAYRYNRDELYATQLFVATTLLSLFTLPLIMLLV